MRDDINKYIHQRKKADKRFADGFDTGYQEFKIGYLLRNARHQSGITQDGMSGVILFPGQGHGNSPRGCNDFTVASRCESSTYFLRRLSA